jgi:ketosteroid isomerase-like protein
MSNVEVMREFWRTWMEEGAAAILARYDEFFTDDAEWCPPTRELTGMRYEGRHGFEQYVHDLDQVLEGLQGELEEVSEPSPNVVRSRVRMRAHGKISGVALDAAMIGIARYRDGRMALAWASYDPEAAMRAEEAIVRGERVPI